MSTVDYLLYAEGGGANVVTQPTYVGAAWRPTGFLPGLADASQANKVWRQSSFMAAAIANFVSGQLGVDVLDNGDLAGFLANLIAAIGQTPRNARIVTASTALLLAQSDYAVALNRTVAPAPTAVTLWTAPVVGQEQVVEDLAANFDLYPVTVSAPGMTIGGAANFVMNEARQGAVFRYYGSNLWTVRT